MERFYMVFADNRQSGPYSVAQLESLQKNGELPSNSLVWTEGMKEWQPLASVLPPIPAAIQPAMRSVPPSAPSTPAARESDHTFMLVAHILMGVWLFTGGLSSIVAVIMAYVKRPDVAGTYLESHCKWIAETFWWTLGIGFLGAILTPFLIGLPILFGVFVWSVYRVIMGAMRISERRAL
ncbi:MAG: GYF domain-containing protein [Deinococcales bacterium]